MVNAMKNIFLRHSRGFSTLELLVSFAVFTLIITASMMVVFGNQSTVLDTQLSNVALQKANLIMATTTNAARYDFNSVVSTSSISDIYSQNLAVTDISQCLKKVVDTVSWQPTPLRHLKTELTTFLSDWKGALALGGDCIVDPPIGGWTSPATLMSRDLKYKAAYNDNPLVNSSPGNQGTDVDVLNKMVYMTAGVSASLSKDDFFILDSSNVISGIMPPIVGSLNTGPGLNAVDVVHYNATGKTYAYVVQNDNQSQFQVIDVSTSASLTPPIASISLPNITFTCSPASAPCLAGQSIFYYNGMVYIGTNYIANLGLPSTKNNEFHVFCVSDSSVPGCSPATPVWMGSANVEHNINDIVVRSHYAYLATSDDAGELTVLDLNNLSAPGIKFDAPGSEDGESLYIIGNKLYLGRDRTPAARKDFYILDISSPLIIPPILGYKNLGLQSGTAVTGIRIIGNFAFLALSDSNVGFRVLNISNPATVDTDPPLSSFNFSQKTSGLDFEDKFIYTSNESNDALRIIRPTQCADTIDDDGDSKIDSADPQCHSDGNANNHASYNPEDDNE